MVRVKWNRWLVIAMWIGFGLLLSAWKPIQACNSVGYLYRQVQNTEEIGADIDAKQGDPGANPILVIYRIDEMWNRTGKDFKVDYKNFRSCTNKDGKTVLLPVPGAVGPGDKITLKDDEGISVNVALVFFCTLKPGQSKTDKFDLTYTDPKLVTIHSGGPIPFTPAIGSLPK